MNNSIYILFLILLPFSSVFSQKMGHFNSQQILLMMPDIKKIEKELKTYQSDIQNELTNLMKDLETKTKKYQTESETKTKFVNESRAKELQGLQQKILEYRQSATLDLKSKETELLKPLIKKINDAIKKVSKERNIKYVFDSSKGSVVVAPPEDDITKHIKKKLGIK